MQVDTVIVVAGTAGLSALREVRRYTVDFLLCNEGHFGTTCAAVGCMPSKELIEAADVFHRRGAFQDFRVHEKCAWMRRLPSTANRASYSTRYSHMTPPPNFGPMNQKPKIH